MASPKNIKFIDLHTHFEGAVPPKALASLFLKKVDSQGKYLDTPPHPILAELLKNHEISSKFNSSSSRLVKTYTKILAHNLTLQKPSRNLKEFIQRMPTPLIRQLVQTPDDLETLINSTIEQFRQTHKYIELLFSPFALINAHINLEEILAVFDKISKEKRNKKFIKFVMCLRRDREDLQKTNLSELLEIMKNLNENFKIDIAGDEANYPLSSFTEQIQDLIRMSCEITLHVGETTDRDIEFVLGEFPEIRRFNHGIKILKQPKLVKIARKRGIHFAISPLSNIFTGSASENEAKRNLRMFNQLQLDYSISSDDPTIIKGDILAPHKFAQRGLL